LEFVVDKVALGQVFIQELRFSPVNIIPTLLHTHLHLYVALTRRAKGRSLGTLKKGIAVSKMGNHWIEKYVYLDLDGLK
jgi:hypothetical protein